MATWTAWSDLLYGGETETRTRADGRDYKVVLNRNRLARGEKVTKKEIGVSDEEWDHLVETGSIRPYPLPEGAGEFTSPATAVMEMLSKDGDIDPNVLMELALQHPPAINPPAEEASTPEGA